MRVLLVEDDQSFAEVLTQALINQRYLVDTATDGESGWHLADAFAYDLILLDLGLPGLDGIQICQRLRGRESYLPRSLNQQTPILLMTAQDTSLSKVRGLDAGADDYIVKPFDIDELLARVRALLRRRGTERSPVLKWAGLLLDPSTCDVQYQNRPLRVTSKEYKLLELLLRHPQQIFSHDKLVEHLWDLDDTPTDNAIRAQIKGLRKKLKEVGAEDLIETIYGLGYRLKEAKKAETIQEAEGKKDGQKEARHAPKSFDISSLWEQYRKTYCDRLRVLEQAATALKHQTLTTELRQQAQQEAHTLKGSLGLFGLDEASQLSHKIEQILNAPDLLIQTIPLANLITQLRDSILFTDIHPILFPTSTAPSPIQLLVIATDPDFTTALSQAANQQNIQVQVATSLSHIREVISHSLPQVVLLDLTTHPKEQGFELLKELAMHQPSIPILTLTEQNDFAERVRVAQLGGKGTLQKPIAPDQVMAMVTQVLQRLTLDAGSILIVDDDAIVLDQLRNILLPWGFHLTLLNHPHCFWQTLDIIQPDLLILDIEMPELNGIDLCQIVRNDQRWGDLPILFLSAHTDEATIQRVFSAGADDYISKPIRAAELVARVLSRLRTARMMLRLRQRLGD